MLVVSNTKLTTKTTKEKQKVIVCMYVLQYIIHGSFVSSLSNTWLVFWRLELQIIIAKYKEICHISANNKNVDNFLRGCNKKNAL